MSINADINGFVEVYGEHMDNEEKDLLREIFDRFADSPHKQDNLLDLLHSLVAQGYEDGRADQESESGDTEFSYVSRPSMD